MMPQAGRRGQDGLRWLLGSGTSGHSYFLKRISQAKPRHASFPSCARLASSAKRASPFTRHGQSGGFGHSFPGLVDRAQQGPVGSATHDQSCIRYRDGFVGNEEPLLQAGDAREGHLQPLC